MKRRTEAPTAERLARKAKQATWKVVDAA